MAFGAVLCLSLMLSGYATAFPMSQVGCASTFSNGCCQGSLTACAIRVHHQPTCYCDQDCHGRNNCCDDIETIGCHAQCADAGLDPGNCQVTATVNCQARPHKCYCDSLCNSTRYCDCCDDVSNGCYLSNRNKTHNFKLNEVLKDVETMERRLQHYLSSLQSYQRKLSTAQSNNAPNNAETMERRLHHYPTSYYERRPDRLPTQSKEADDAEMLEWRLLQYLTSSQSYRRRHNHLEEVGLLERALAELAKEYTSKKNN